MSCITLGIREHGRSLGETASGAKLGSVLGLFNPMGQRIPIPVIEERLGRGLVLGISVTEEQRSACLARGLQPTHIRVKGRVAEFNVN